MHAVVIEGESDHDGVHAEDALEVADDRDRATLADGERFLTPFSGERGPGLGERWTVERHFGCWRAGEALELDLGISRQTRPHEGMEGGANRFRVLRPHQAKGYLGRGLSRDDGFRTFSGVASDHAVDFGRRARG